MNRLDPAWDLVRARDATAQLYVSCRGRTLLHRGMRCDQEALFWTFSASKPVMSVLAYRLIERGAFALDDPIARHWPEFARGGKSQITVRDVLQHRTGMPLAGSAAVDALAMPDWRLETSRIARARPHLDPAVGPAYQWVIYGYIVGELAQRVTGRPLSHLLRDEILGPLTMTETHLGVPPSLVTRCVPLRGVSLAERAAAPFLNSRRVRRAVIPSAGISTTARSLARLYESLLGHGRPVIGGTSLAAATTPSWRGQLDQFLKVPAKWGQGFQLGGSLAAALPPSPAAPTGRGASLRPAARTHCAAPTQRERSTERPARPARSRRGAIRPSAQDAARWVSAFGSRSHESTFGHNGSNCCIAWADPERSLVFVYLTDRWSIDAHAHLTEVADAVLAGVDRT